MTTFTLDLPDETAERLRADAEAQGVHEKELLRAIVVQRYATAPAGAQGSGHEASDAGPRRTLRDRLAPHIGAIDSSKTNGGQVSRLSEDKQAFGEYLEQKHREGRL
jgi:hypothetical protein